MWEIVFNLGASAAATEGGGKSYEFLFVFSTLSFHFLVKDSALYDY